MRKNLLSFIVVAVLCMPLAAQTVPISVPFSVGFEESDSLELKNWVLNPGVNASKCVDQWVVGEAAKSTGERSLYISADNGASACFGIARNVQYAYRDISLPKGVYEISFDWCCLGTSDAAMYAGVGLASDLPVEAVSNSAAIPSKVSAWCKTVGRMASSSLWKNASLSMNSRGESTTYRLFFVWSSANQDTTLALPLGGCIDNIQICLANCARPKSVSATSTCDSIFLSWVGTSEKYSVEYRRRGKKWSTPAVYEQESCVFENMDEGLYDFRVRGICNGTDTSAYTYLSSYVLFCPEKHCINYVNLHDSLHVVCTYGTFSNPYAATGVIDNGFGNQEQYFRHTVNWEPDQYDPRTLNQLPLIPDGELASVRLGNWLHGAEGESISYEYVADVENAAILFLKYAIVLEDPAHGASSNPRFTMEVLDENGYLLSPTCGAADFYADANRKDGGWHSANVAGYSTISWKEWTTVGLNLAELGVKTGDVLTIRLTTKDCAWSAHFGYAYFTLGCATARLYGTSCGSDANMSIAAPDGFRYEWYNKNNELVSTEKQLSLPASDTTTYRCRLIFKENEECDFNLYSSLRPRFPISEFSYSYEPANCENRVRFSNKSHIMTVFNGDTVHHYDEACDEYLWDFGSGNESSVKNPVFAFPQSGGTFPVTLFSSISDGACQADTTLYITLPKIGDTEQTLDTTICDGTYIEFGKYYAAEERIYYDSLKSVAGCDSVWILNLKVHPVSHLVAPDTTVCAEVPLCIDGKCYQHTTSGEFVRFWKDSYGCDSTISMYVHILDSILPTVVLVEPEDREGTGSITVGGTGYDYYYLNGVRYDASQTYFSGLDGGVFDFQFFNDFGCSVGRSDTMYCECLQLRLGDIAPVCLGADSWVIPLVIDSGIPTTYSVLFDSVAHAAGLADIIDARYTKQDQWLEVPVPASLAPYRYHAQLLFSNSLGDCRDTIIGVELPLFFSEQLIYQRWNDVLSVRGTGSNGGYTFTAFQWQKNGQDIAGATRSYYYEEGGLDTSAEYQVWVTLPDGTIVGSCPFTPAADSDAPQSPKKTIEHQRLVITHDGVQYNAQGMKLYPLAE